MLIISIHPISQTYKRYFMLNNKEVLYFGLSEKGLEITVIMTMDCSKDDIDGDHSSAANSFTFC